MSTCVTFPRASHPAPVLRSLARLQADLQHQQLLLAQHIDKRPGVDDLNARAKWAMEKDVILLEINIIEGQISNRWHTVLPPNGTLPQEPAPVAPTQRPRGGQPGSRRKTPSQRIACALHKAALLLDACRQAPDFATFVRRTDQINSLRSELRNYCVTQGLEMPAFPANLPNPFRKAV